MYTLKINLKSSLISITLFFMFSLLYEKPLSYAFQMGVSPLLITTKTSTLHPGPTLYSPYRAMHCYVYIAANSVEPQPKINIIIYLFIIRGISQIIKKGKCLAHPPPIMPTSPNHYFCYFTIY